MENAKTVESINAELSKLNDEFSQAETELRELEAAADTTAKGLDAHGRLASKIAMLRSRKTALELEILPAKRAEAAAKVEQLTADYKAAFGQREKIMAECREKIAAWYDYAGGGAYLSYALAGAKPVREANSAAMTLQNQLAGAQAHLRELN